MTRVSVLRCGAWWACSLTLLLAGLAPAASARQRSPQPDRAAPAGAPASWLPQEAWVLQRWVPFDEPALERRLGMDTASIARYLDATGATLNGLARRRGVATDGLAARLVASRGLPAGSPLRAVLLERTRRVLTQSHLAVHVLTHVFHTWTVTRHTDAIFGVGQARFIQLYEGERRPLRAIAAAGGVSLAALRTRALRAAAESGRQGLAEGALSVRENRILRARDRRNFPSWAAYRVLCTLG